MEVLYSYFRQKKIIEYEVFLSSTVNPLDRKLMKWLTGGKKENRILTH